MYRNPPQPQRSIDPAIGRMMREELETAIRQSAGRSSVSGQARTTTSSPPRASRDDWTLAIVLLVFGGIGWIAGAFFTLHGWVVGLNMFFGWTSLPVNIPTPVGWWILAMVPIGVVYSRVELQIWRRKQRDWQSTLRFVIGWLLIILTDVGTTYLGVRQPGATLPILVWVASSAVVSLMWSVVLTFASDWMIIGGVRLLKR